MNIIVRVYILYKRRILQDRALVCRNTYKSAKHMR